jgi:hypothetical protein
LRLQPFRNRQQFRPELWLSAQDLEEILARAEMFGFTMSHYLSRVIIRLLSLSRCRRDHEQSCRSDQTHSFHQASIAHRQVTSASPMPCKNSGTAIDR